jgi:hypothetical protein
MVRSVIISGKDLVQISSPYNDTYKYTFPTGMVRFEDCEIAVASLTFWYSFYNITELNRNNYYTYTWNANTTTSYDVTIPDGSYQIDDLNAFLQFTFIQNKHYLIDASGNYVYYLEILWNPTKYLNEIIAYPLPTTLPTGWSYPSGATWTLPATPQTPQIAVTRYTSVQRGLGWWLGFDTGTYPPTPQTSIYNVLAQNIDRMFPVSSVVLGCSLLQNTLAVPATTLFTMPVEGHTYGERVSSIGQFAFVPITDGQYNEFFIRLYDQDGNRLVVNDPDLSVSMVIRKKGEVLPTRK